MKRIAVSGGAAVTVCQAPQAPYGMTWDSSGIVFGQGSNGILRCSASGGKPEQLATVAEGEEAHGPQLLLDGSALLFTIAKAADGATRWDTAQIVVQTMGSGGRKTIVSGGSDARHLETGHLLYAVGGIVFAVPFDVAQMAVTGEPVPVVEGVRRAIGGATGATQFATSSTGTLLYVSGPTGRTTAEQVLAMAIGPVR